MSLHSRQKSFRRAALAGEAIEVRDREGTALFFAPCKATPKALRQRWAICWVASAAVRPEKTLTGYGRD
jgi:hypothetical protein